MDGDCDFFPSTAPGAEAEIWDPQQLLHQEVKTLARRVDALIKWTEEFEDQIIFFGKTEAGKKGEQSPKSGLLPKLVMEGGTPEGSFEDAFKPQDKQVNDDVDGAREGGERGETESSGEIDLFGASTSFADFKVDFSQQQGPNKVSLLEFD